jgi:hypothetical protein
MFRLNDLIRTLEAQGLQAGLDYLNRRVPHRYTGIFELLDGVFYAREVVDKRGEPFPEAYKVVPFRDSFCPITVSESGFRTHDSANDACLDGIKNQGIVCSYVGLPLLRHVDDLYGTLCHFDVGTCAIGDEEFEYLKRASVLLPKYLLATAPAAHPYLPSASGLAGAGSCMPSPAGQQGAA